MDEIDAMLMDMLAAEAEGWQDMQAQIAEVRLMLFGLIQGQRAPSDERRIANFEIDISALLSKVGRMKRLAETRWRGIDASVQGLTQTNEDRAASQKAAAVTASDDEPAESRVLH